MKQQSTQNSLCPCGSQIDFTLCCEPVLANHQRAVTAEALMRSRYTGFVKEDTSHLLRTWFEKTRPSTLNFDNHPVKWISLTINKTNNGQPGDSKGTVDFTSTYIENGQLCSLNEISDFVKIEGLWYYVNGICEVTKKTIERNRPCPCGSQKKFKRCCYIK